MITRLPLQNEVNGKSESNVHALPEGRTFWGHLGSVVRCGIPICGNSAGVILHLCSSCLWEGCSHFWYLLVASHLCVCASCKVLCMWDTVAYFLCCSGSPKLHSFSNQWLTVPYILYTLPRSLSCAYVLQGLLSTSAQHQIAFSCCPCVSLPKDPRSTGHWWFYSLPRVAV